MRLKKCLSAPSNLYFYALLNNDYKRTLTFNNFKQLELNGQQKLLTFGEYSNKKLSTKNKRQKIVSYFYKRIQSRL